MTPRNKWRLAAKSLAATIILMGATWGCLSASALAGDEQIRPQLTPGFRGDNTADGVLGQINFSFSTKNFVDGAGLSTNTGTNFGAVAIDKTVNPNRIYVADTANNRVLGWVSISAFTTHASANIVFGQPDLFTSACNSSGINASSLCNPTGVAVDPNNGNVYVADYSNHRVLEYNSPFTTDRVADDVFGQFGAFTTNFCDNSGLSSDSLCNPAAVAVDSGGNLYVADQANNRVLEYNTPEVLTATPGSGDTTADRVFGQADNFTVGGCNSVGISADSLCSPTALAVDPSRNLFVADSTNNRVLEYFNPLITDTTADRVFGQLGNFTTNSPNNGGINANSLSNPPGIAIDSIGRLYVSDRNNNRALGFKPPFGLNPSASIVFGQRSDFTATICNNSFLGTSPPVSSESLCSPTGAGVDGSGNLYLVDTFNNRVLKYNTPFTTNVTADGVVGQALFTTGASNLIDGRGFDFSFSNSEGGVVIDNSHSPARVYVVDTNNSRVLAWNNISAFTTHAPANLVIGQPSFFTNICNINPFTTVGVSGVPSRNNLCHPRAAAVDSAGNLYISDQDNNRVLEYNSPFTTDTAADRVFGQGGFFTTPTCNASGISATSLCTPIGIAIDKSGRLYVADFSNSRVLEYNAPLSSQSANHVFGQLDFFTTNTCNLGGISATSLCTPSGVAVDSSLNVYIADFSNSRVLEYNTPLTTNTTADRVFGQGNSFTVNGCDRIGVNADSLCSPRFVAVDSSKNLYISDAGNNRVLMYRTPLTTDTTADQVFGQGGQFSQSNCKAPSPNALCAPDGISVDTFKNLYVVDASYFRVLQFLAP
jgi:sugar lactone lactonase YvrE